MKMGIFSLNLTRHYLKRKKHGFLVQMVLDSQNNVLYYIKDCIDDYTYNIEENGHKRTFSIKENALLHTILH